MKKKQLLAILTPLAFCACSQVPDGVLNRSKMESVLYDVHIAEGIMEEYPTQYRSLESKQKLMAGVFHDNGITKAEFDSSMVYYGAHLDQYMKIYQKVSERLNKQKEQVSAELLAYEKSLLTPVGDSVDLWREPAQLILDPALLATTRIFEIKADSNFKADDKVIWSMRFNNLPSDSLAYAYVALGNTQGSDKTQQVTAFAQENGWLSLEVTLPELATSDRIFGSVSLISRRDTLFNPVYIDSISLNRYHYKQVAISVDSLPSDSVISDSLKSDSLTGIVPGSMQVSSQIVLDSIK